MRRSIKKVIAMGIVTTMVLATGLTGCGKGGDDANGKGAGGKKTEFKFITAMSDAERTEILDSVVDQLKEKYPDVTFINDSGEDYNNKAKFAFSSGSGYDLIFTDDLGLTALREADYLLDLGEHVKERGWVDRQMEGATDFYNKRTPGKQYSVGMNYAPVIVFYNKEIFKELNVEIPTTIEEYENILKLATEKGYIGAENCKDNINGWYIQSLVQNHAPFADVVDWYYLEKSSDSVKEAFMDSSKIIKDWSDAGYFRKDYEGIDYGDVASLFGQGKTAMSLDGNWFLYEYENTGLDVGVFAFPGSHDASKENYIINPVDAAFAVGSQVDETQLAVAIDFIDLMLSPEVAAQWLEKGSIPSIKHEFEDSVATPLTKELLELLPNTKSGFYLDNVRPGFLEIYTKETQLFLTGDQTVDDMWKKIDTFWHEG